MLRKPYKVDGLWRIDLTKGKTVTLDEEDAHWAAQWNWHALKKRNNFYAARTTSLGGVRRNVYLHREVAERAGVDVTCFVDHVDTDTFNNRRSNLRAATVAQNTHNTKMHHDNKSGVKGVSYCKTNHVWRGEVMLEGVRHCRRFDNMEDAADFVKSLRPVLHGEFSRSTV